jgi:hypothetical protein
MINERGLSMLDTLVPLSKTLTELLAACRDWSYRANHPWTTIQFEGVWLYGCDDKPDVYEEIRKVRRDTYQKYLTGSTTPSWFDRIV